MRTLIGAVSLSLVVLLADCAGYQYMEKPYVPLEPEKAMTPQQNLIGQNNPCSDSTYLKLKAKPLEQLSDREFEMLKIREKACVDYLAQMQRSAQVQETVAAAQSSANSWYWLAAVTTLAYVIYLIAK